MLQWLWSEKIFPIPLSQTLRSRQRWGSVLELAVAGDLDNQEQEGKDAAVVNNGSQKMAQQVYIWISVCV
jgi:hypothetical protein